MKVISSDVIYSKVKEAILDAGINLREDVLLAIKKAKENETNDIAVEILDQILKNAEVAREYRLPLCQDTGIGMFFVEVGYGCKVEGGGLKEVLTKAMVDAYREGYFRCSMCDPFTRQNTKDNSPALFHFDFIEEDSLRVYFMAKGGGSENMSFCSMLVPSVGWEGIKKFVVEKVKNIGPNPCPPILIGVGIGGSFDQAPILAKKALFRPVGTLNKDPDLRIKEQELLEDINKLNIGPMGMGGRTTCLGVHICTSPCHIATLPVAVNIQCHSIRWRLVEF